MSAKVAPSGAPPYAVPMWVDDSHIYMEIPNKKTNVPYISKFALTEGGLGKALGIMREGHRKHQPRGGRYNITKQAAIKKLKPTSRHIDVTYTKDQRQKAFDVLKKMGLI